jgi:two-component system chemotaxis sensor kinase CheA
MAINPKVKEAALAEYLDECSEMAERFSKNLLIIESGKSSPEILAAIYRDMHTIKGTSQLFGFTQVGQLAHAMESCLDPVRNGQASVSPALVDTMYAGLDIITTLLKGIRETREEPNRNGDITSLIPKLIAIAEQPVTGSVPSTKDKDPSTDTMPRSLNEVLKTVSTENRKIDENPGFGFFDDEEPTVHATKPSSLEVISSTVVLSVASSPVTISPVAVSAASPSQLTAPKETPIKMVETPSKAPSEDQQSETIRVHVSLLDNLMNLVGELVLIRNQFLQKTKVDDDAEFAKMGQQLNVLTAELQNEVMKTRMQPIGNILNKFTRVVRDMGRDLGKKIDIELEGAETELDKTIIEAIKDPLTHIVRNAVDHGIEMPADRKAAGKSETGRIRLKARHESGQVIIEIVDDGRGLDRHTIGSKAVEKGLVTADVLSKMSEREVQFLIFAPGFSTAASISNISGRGVGMDVVRTNVERIGGVVDLASVAGSGSTIKLKIPLTLAIVPALIVRTSGQRFAIPQAKLVELLRIDESDGIGERIEYLQGKPVLRLRGKLLALVKLSEVLSGSSQDTTHSGQERGSSQDAVNVVILNADSFLFGLIVDEIEDSADIVVKSLSQYLKNLELFSGATIMGDGAVALTIDVMGISKTACLAGEDSVESQSVMSQIDLKKLKVHQTDAAEFLLVDVGAPGSYAIPLTIVSRLEEFETASFELSGEQKVIRYRDSLLPILSLPDFLQLPYKKEREQVSRASVVVIQRGDRLYGVEVYGIQDVVTIATQIDQSVRDRAGILGSLASDGRVYVVVDILGMIDSLKARMEGESASIGNVVGIHKGSKSPTVSLRSRHRILVVEDSSFFRNYIKQTLLEAGFSADVACDGGEGYSMLESASPGYYSLVLSDIEMPIMNGLNLAKKIRGTPKLAEMPLVAISTRFSNSDIASGRQAGFSVYLEKLNAEKLLGELDAILVVEGKETKRAANE